MIRAISPEFSALAAQGKVDRQSFSAAYKEIDRLFMLNAEALQKQENERKYLCDVIQFAEKRRQKQDGAVMSTPTITQEDQAASIFAAIFLDLTAELAAAIKKHPEPPASGHEIYGIITEELDEFFDLVKADHPCMYDHEKELLHVAVTALRGAAVYRAKRRAGAA